MVVCAEPFALLKQRYDRSEESEMYSPTASVETIRSNFIARPFSFFFNQYKVYEFESFCLEVALEPKRDALFLPQSD